MSENGNNNLALTRDETISFIQYLKTHEIEPESQPYIQKTFFNHYLCDSIGQAREYLRLIREANSPAEAYHNIAFQAVKQNCNWKLCREFSGMFREDMEEYLQELGCPGLQETQELLGAHALSKKARELEKKLPDGFRRWISGMNVPLGSREELVELFPTTYMQYRHETFNDPKESYTIQRLPESLGWRTYKLDIELLRKVADPKRVTIAYNSQVSGVTEEKLTEIGKFLCEELNMDRIILRDYSKPEYLVIRKPDAETPQIKDSIPEGFREHADFPREGIDYPEGWGE